MKVKILHVHNASSFSARLLEHTDIGGFPVPVPDEYFTVNMAVYSHYSDERNRYKQYQRSFVNCLFSCTEQEENIIYFIVFCYI